MSKWTSGCALCARTGIAIRKDGTLAFHRAPPPCAAACEAGRMTPQERRAEPTPSSERLSLRAAAVGVSGDGVTGRLIRFQREPEKESPERLASRIAALKTAETCIRAQREELEERLRSKRSRSRGDRRG